MNDCDIQSCMRDLFKIVAIQLLLYFTIINSTQLTM